MPYSADQLLSLAETTLPAHLGIVFDELTSDHVTGHLEWRTELSADGNILHGGTLMAFADSLGAFGTGLALPDGVGTATLESKTNFFRAARPGTIHGESTKIHQGRHSMVWQTDVTQEGKLLARVTQTQSLFALPAS